MSHQKDNRKRTYSRQDKNNSSNKSRKASKDRKNHDLEQLPILFLLYKSLVPVESEYPIDWDQLPFHDKIILNLDIFELNDVMSLTINDDVPYGQLMNVDHNSSEHAVSQAKQLVTIRHGLNQNTNQDLNLPGCTFLTPMLANGMSSDLPYAEQAIAFAFLQEMQSHATINYQPQVYFVKRDTLLAMILDPLKRDVAFNFIANNFRFVYGGNADDINNRKVSEYADVSVAFTEQSQWHHSLDFCTKLGVKGCVNFYPPLTITHCLDDKYLQKKLLGPLGLPAEFMKIPIRDTDDNSSEHKWWASISWNELYEHLSQECTFPGHEESLAGLVIKPRYGACGSMVIILELIVDEDDVNGNTINCRPAQGKIFDTPNDYYASNETEIDVIIEPYCPELMTNEHRIFMVVPKTGKALTMFAYTQANYNFVTGKMCYTPVLDTNRSTMELLFPTLSHLLLQQLRSTKNTNMMTSGVVYRVDIFRQKNLPVMDGVPKTKQWRINEMELVPNAQTFINRLNTHGNILIELGKGFMNYIIDNYNQHYPV